MDIRERRLWNISMIPLVKRRGLVSPEAKRWIEFMIQKNEAYIAEVMADDVLTHY